MRREVLTPQLLPAGLEPVLTSTPEHPPLLLVTWATSTHYLGQRLCTGPMIWVGAIGTSLRAPRWPLHGEAAQIGPYIRHMDDTGGSLPCSLCNLPGRRRMTDDM